MNSRRLRRRPRDARRGVLLMVVLVVVALMSIANLSYFDWTFAERKAADAASRRAQARAASDSVVELLRVYLAQEPAAIDQDGGWYDNAARFRGVLIADGLAPELRSRAAVVAPQWGAQALEGARFGLEDDSGRLNLNALLVAEAREEGAGRDQLLALPGMTEAIADAILDWLDDDDLARPAGAEADYYSSLEPPYAPTNGPLRTIEQLLRVKDVTPDLLWGLDQDRNHVVSPAEAASIALPVDNSTGELNGGWASMLTLGSAERNIQPDGQPKINVNAEDLERLHEDIEAILGLDAANFVVAYRQGGPEDELTDGAMGPGGSDEAEQPREVSGLGEDGEEIGGGGQDGQSLETKDAAAVTIDFDAPAAVTIGDPLDLVGVTIRVVEAGELSPVLVDSPWGGLDGAPPADLTLMMDTLTTTDAESIPGRVNINQAPRAVLAGLPEMPPGTVDAIVANRDPAAGATRPDRLHATWLLTEGYVDLETMRALAPYVTGQGAVFRAQAVGGWESGGPVERQEVLIDTTVTPPRVTLRRDLSALGAGFDPAVALVPEELAGPAP